MSVPLRREKDAAISQYSPAAPGATTAISLALTDQCTASKLHNNVLSIHGLTEAIVSVGEAGSREPLLTCP